MMRLKGLRTISELFLSSSLYVVLPVFIMVVLLMSGCMKTDSGKISEDGEIKFTVGSMPSTKTAYKHGDKSLQLIWVDGDQVSIFCDQAQGEGNKKVAAYNVTPQSDSTKGNLSIAEGDGIGLRWNDDKTKLHNLYAVYPSKNYSRGNVIKEPDEGVFTFNFPKTQECSIAGGYTAVNGSYMLKPQMYLAYMVAKKEDLTPENNAVELHFKPIATTLEITLQGAAQGDVEVSRLDLEVLVTNTVNGNASDNNRLVKNDNDKSTYQIQFNAKKDYSLDVYNSLVAYPTSNLPNGVAYFSVKLPAGEGGKYTIGAGKSVTFTVFLPPIKNLDNVTVKCIGSDGATELGRKQIFVNKRYASPASKSFIKMPPFTGGGGAVPTKTLDYLDVESTTGITSVKEGEKLQLKATAYYTDGSDSIVTYSSACTWSPTSGSYAATVDNSSSKGLVTGKFPGSQVITASYTENGVNRSDIITITVTHWGGSDDTFGLISFYQWDAYATYNPKNYNEGFGPAYSGYNKSEVAKHSCCNAPTFDQIQMYLAAGVYWVDDGPAYESPDGKTYNTGIMLKRSYNILEFNGVNAKRNTSAIPIKGFSYEELKKDYFFLPACGGYLSGSFSGAGTYGNYWSSTPDTTSTSNAYSLGFYSGLAYVLNDTRSFGYVPMPRL